MISRKLMAAAALAASSLVAAPAWAGPNLIQNGSFEANTGEYVCPTSWSCTKGGPEPVTYWNTSVSGFPAYQTSLAASPDGGNVFAMSGLNSPGFIYQSLTGLVIGATYDVSFYYADANRAATSFAGTVGWTVGVNDGTSIVSTVLGTASIAIPKPGASNGWLSQTYSFVATQTSELLSFASTASVPVSPEPLLLLDGVNVQQRTAVTAPVPEPSTWALTLGGLAAIGVIARRRQRKNG